MRTRQGKLSCHRLPGERTKNMSTIAADLQNFNQGNSRTITSYAGIDNANAWRGSYPIPEGMLIRVFCPDATAIVMHPFFVEVRLIGDEYFASSHITNSFEIGETPGW